jgi:hypothetical protein
MSLETIAIDFNHHFTELSIIRDSIELMSKFNQVEILRILTNNKNVTDLGVHLIEELKMYISYVKSQEIQLDQSEKQKETFKNTYFVKGVKDM